MPGAPSPGRGPDAVKILLLEDDLRLRSLVARGLHREGHAVDEVGTVEDARWMLAECAYDVAILDVMVPDGDGFSLCRELRTNDQRVPVLFLTARDSVDDRVRGLDAGGDDYLVKPFAFRELLARLRSLVRRGPATRAPVLRVGDLVLDPATHMVRIGDQTLDLTHRQFALLECLCRRPEVVMTRSDIIDQVWDWAFEGPPRIVDVYVRSLREVVGRGPERPVIHTVRGVGYALRRAPGIAESRQATPLDHPGAAGHRVCGHPGAEPVPCRGTGLVAGGDRRSHHVGCAARLGAGATLRTSSGRAGLVPSLRPATSPTSCSWPSWMATGSP